VITRSGQDRLDNPALELGLLTAKPSKAGLGLAELGVDLFLVVAGKLSLLDHGAIRLRNASDGQKWQGSDRC